MYAAHWQRLGVAPSLTHTHPPLAFCSFFRDQVHGHSRDFFPTGEVFQTMFHDCLGSFEGQRWVETRKVFDVEFGARNVANHATALDAKILQWKHNVTKPGETTQIALESSGCDELPLRTLTRLIFGDDSHSDADRAAVLHLMTIQRQLISCMFHPSTRIPGYRRFAKCVPSTASCCFVSRRYSPALPQVDPPQQAHG